MSDYIWEINIERFDLYLKFILYLKKDLARYFVLSIQNYGNLFELIPLFDVQIYLCYNKSLI